MTPKKVVAHEKLTNIQNAKHLRIYYVEDNARRHISPLHLSLFKSCQLNADVIQQQRLIAAQGQLHLIRRSHSCFPFHETQISLLLKPDETSITLC